MKLLLDENLPHELRLLLSPHEVFTATYMGWSGIRNGQLLARAAGEEYDAVVTLDAGIEFEQNLQALPCSVIVLRAPSKRMRHLLPLLPELLNALTTLQPCTLLHVG
jgi:predicted nuclease of predicted toxin-antitoxin system